MYRNMYRVKKRCRYILIIFNICFLLLVCRIAYFNVIKSDKIYTWIESQYSYKQNLTELNYSLLDSKNRSLLDFKTQYFIVIDPIIFLREFNEADIDNVYALEYTLKSYNKNYDIPTLNEMYNHNKITYEIDDNTYSKLNEIKGLKGVYLYEFSSVDRSETWKIENILTNILDKKENKIKDDNTLEMDIHEATKDNDYPEIVFPVDQSGNVSNGKINMPQNNTNIRLTLDKDIEKAIEEVIQKYDYNQIGVIIIESDTGKIKAMVQKNNKESNINLGGIGDGFEPGSIFKILIEEAALESNKIKNNETFISKGRLENEKHTIGELSLKQAFAESSNDVFSQIGRKTGINNILYTANNQGFFSGERVLQSNYGIIKKSSKVLNLHDERTGYFKIPQCTGDLNLISIGQNMKITPIQAIAMSSTVINGGYYIKPSIIDAYVDNNNNIIKSITNEKSKVLSEDTSAILKEHMKSSIENDKGTGRAAFIEGIEVGGKTGTSTRMERSIKDNTLENHSDGWFTGFFKSNNNYYSAVVIVANIDSDTESASSTAVPIFKEIVQNIRIYL